MEAEFYQRIVLFYYRYLLQRYFRQLKNAKYIKARYSAINARLKERRRTSILGIYFEALKDCISEKRRDDEAGDLLAARVIIYPRLMKVLASKRDLASNKALADLYRLKALFRTFRAAVESQLAERRAEIRAERHYYQRRQRLALFVLRHAKALDAAVESRNVLRADGFQQRALVGLIRRCFSSLALNAWAKFFPYRSALRLAYKKRVFQALGAAAKQSLASKQVIFKKEQVFRARCFAALKLQVGIEKRLREVQNLIERNQKSSLVRRGFAFMLGIVRKKKLLNSLKVNYDEERNHKVAKLVLRGWMLARRERYIEKVLVPKIKIKAFFSFLSQKIASFKTEEVKEQEIRKFRYTWGTKFLVFLLRMNSEVSKAKKEQRSKSENQWKSVIFDAFVNQIRRQQRLAAKSAVIEQRNLKIKFRVWRDRTLDLLTLNFHHRRVKIQVLKNWKAVIQEQSRMAASFRQEANRNLQQRCLYSLQRYKDACNKNRYQLLQAITFERCSSKRRVFERLRLACGSQSAEDSQVIRAANVALLKRFTAVWRLEACQNKTASAEAGKRNKLTLGRCFAEWQAVGREESRKTEREREAGKRFWQERKKELVVALMEKALEHKAKLEESVALEESYKRKKAIRFAHAIGRRWLERVRKRLKDRASIRTNLRETSYTLRPYKSDYENQGGNYGKKDSGGHFSNTGGDKEGYLESYLLNFKTKKRLAPTGFADKVHKNEPQKTKPSSQGQVIGELEKMLEDYRVKASLLQDESLPFSIRQLLLKDQAALKDKIKELYAALNSA